MSIKLVIIQLFILFKLLHGYNFSPKPNLIIKEPQLITYFPKEQSSYFGFTINLRPGSITIGAPRAQSTIESQKNINQTGAVFRYSFRNNKCEPYIFDLHGNHHTKNDDFAWHSEEKDFQWLGGSMDGGSKDTDPLFVCAPRMRDDAIHEYLLHGICYWTMDTIEDQPVEVKKIAPLRLKTLQAYDKSSNKVYNYMFGEQGISIHWTGQDEDVIIGAPGIYNWKGSVLHYYSKENEDTGGLSKRDTKGTRIFRQAYREYVTDVPSPGYWTADDVSYFGYSVSSGKFDSKNLSKILYVGSAPQAEKQSGEVYIFDIKKIDHGEFTIKKYHTFRGDQFGEFFGYSVLSEDLNNDGFVDLIVSAPLHYVNTHYDKGAVYVFINVGNFNFKKYLIVSPSDKPGRFGTTITNLGDINHDGYNDLAIGAPFENNGTVYIYLGNANGIRQKPSQVLEGFAPKMNIPSMFGHGLSKGVDIDSNGFNDLAVGAPNSDVVYLYKTYPVIKIIASIGSPTREIKADQRKLQIKACFHYETTSKQVRPQEMVFKIKADSHNKRVKFSDGSNEVDFTSMVSKDQQCKNFDASVIYNAKDIFKPIELEMHYEFVKKIPDSEEFCDTCVAVDPDDSNVCKQKIIFSTGCKSEVCIADLVLTSKNIPNTLTIGSSQTLSVQYDITNNGEPAYLPQINITSSNKMEFKKTPPSCIIEDNYILVCDLSRGKPLLTGEKDKLEVSFDISNLEGTEMKLIAEVFSTGKESFPADNTIKSLINLKEYSSIEANGVTNTKIISLEENTGYYEFVNEFEVKNLGPSNLQEIEITISIPISYLIPKSTKRISLVDFENVTVTAEYSKGKLEIDYYQNNSIINQNKNKLTKNKYYGENNEGMHFDSSKLGYSVEDDNSAFENVQFENIMSRRKRSITNKATEAEYARISKRKMETSISDELMGILPINRTISFDCHDPEETLCIDASVRIFNFKANPNGPVTITVKFIVNLDEINKILIDEKEFFVIKNELKVAKIGDLDSETFDVIQVVPYNIISKHQFYKTPLWVIIVSILAGLLLLTLITYGFYKLGFFKRQTREQMAKLVRSSQNQNEEAETQQSLMASENVGN